LLNEEWIDDKIRFSFDGLSFSRIGSPLIRRNNTFSLVSWEVLLLNLFNDLSKVDLNSFLFSTVVSKENSLEDLFTIKTLSNFIGSSNILDEYNSLNDLSYDFINNITFNKDFNFIDKFDQFLLVGLNLRLESPILNLKIRKKYLKTGLPNFLIGTYFNSTYPLIHLGNNINVFKKIFGGQKEIFFTKYNINNLLVLFNNNIPLKSRFINLINENNDFNVTIKIMSSFSNHVSWANLSLGQNCYSMETSFSFNSSIGYKYSYISNIKLLFKGLFARIDYYNQMKCSNKFVSSINYFYNSNNISENISQGSLNIYQGHHGNKIILDKMDYILPGLSFIEKKGTFLNIYNVLQQTSIVFTEPKLARNDVDIFKILNSFFFFFI